MAQMKKAGRREAGANTRDALLKASAELIQENGMRPISIRDIADRADMNQAMVRYQFGDKDGLMKAVLDHGFEQLLESVPENGGFEETLFALVVWMRDNAWLAMLMMQSVYPGDELRTHFETQHAPRLVRLYQGALERGRAANQARDDLDPRFAVSALISLLVFPNLAGPTLGRVLGIGRGTAAARRYTGELLKLFKCLVSVRKVIESYE